METCFYEPVADQMLFVAEIAEREGLIAFHVFFFWPPDGAPIIPET